MELNCNCRVKKKNHYKVYDKIYEGKNLWAINYMLVKFSILINPHQLFVVKKNLAFVVSCKPD